MYIPEHHAENRLDVLHALVRAHPLGTWIVPAEGELLVDHVPFLVDPERGPFGTLTAHVARANPVWAAASLATRSVIVFQGPESYVSPSWYETKRAHGRAVPTWNYAVVHAHGTPRVIHDRAWLRRHLDALTRVHESAASAPWSVDDAPADFIDSLLGAIVGVEIPIAQLVGKWKTSQNRSAADQRGVIAGLRARGDDRSRAMADLVAAHDARSPD